VSSSPPAAVGGIGLPEYRRVVSGARVIAAAGQAKRASETECWHAGPGRAGSGRDSARDSDPIPCRQGASQVSRSRTHADTSAVMAASMASDGSAYADLPGSPRHPRGRVAAGRRARSCAAARRSGSLSRGAEIRGACHNTGRRARGYQPRRQAAASRLCSRRASFGPRGRVCGGANAREPSPIDRSATPVIVRPFRCMRGHDGLARWRPTTVLSRRGRGRTMGQLTLKRVGALSVRIRCAARVPTVPQDREHLSCNGVAQPIG
jgi:hypothetical protein